MTMVDRIREKLESAFQPEKLEVADDSWKHEGHSGARPGGETHFQVDIVSSGFVGKSRVTRQREVYRVLKAELADSIHALALTTRTPDE
jgi:BolA family transcriptional regulator, general stress-responsive regulator